jgi:hypothetical protein
MRGCAQRRTVSALPAHCQLHAATTRTLCPLSLRYHGAGNVGVEYASPEAILCALQRARRSDPQRMEFGRAELMELGLALATQGQEPLGGVCMCAFGGGWEVGGNGSAKVVDSASCVHDDASTSTGTHVLPTRPFHSQLVSLCMRTPSMAPSPVAGAVSQAASQQAARRHAVCAYLGVGPCDSKQLLKQLNRYGFTHAQLQAAVQWAEQHIQQQQ